MTHCDRQLPEYYSFLLFALKYSVLRVRQYSEGTMAEASRAAWLRMQQHEIQPSITRFVPPPSGTALGHRHVFVLEPSRR